jgi:starch-binding outer membrane protein SusE/F
MKNKLIYLLSAAMIALAIASCEKDEHRIYYEDGTPPVLTASTTGPLVLTKATASRTALKLSWTNPNYRFTTGISSQDVTYVLQTDVAGGNFASPRLQESSFAKSLEATFTDTLLNAILARMELAENTPHNIEIRLKASLAGGTVPLYSNVLSLTVTPYLDVAVPIPANGNLWIVGDATANGWDNPLKPQYEATQKFTAVSNTLYELTLAMPGGGYYKLLQDNGVWATQYHMLAGGKWDAGSFEQKDADPAFPGPPSPGTYKITVNFKTGTYTVAKQ